MYTVVPRPQVDDFQIKPGQPSLEIIDHRNTQSRKPSKWKDRRRKEQLPYDTLKEHRDTLLNAELKYKHRISELEKQSEELTKTFDETLQENKVLRSIIEHGPDAVKLKKLKQDKKEQTSVIDTLKEENEELREKIKELEKVFGAPKDFANEKNWKDALEKVKKRRQEEDAIPTQGPFVGAKVLKPKRIALDDDSEMVQDTYDLELDTIEKETQVLLNKIRQLKREKGQIDYALVMGKGSVSRNATIANAINNKLNRDLNKFAIRLEKLKLKHKAAKKGHRVMSSSEPNERILLLSDDDEEEHTCLSRCPLEADGSPNMDKKKSKQGLAVAKSNVTITSTKDEGKEPKSLDIKQPPVSYGSTKGGQKDAVASYFKSPKVHANKIDTKAVAKEPNVKYQSNEMGAEKTPNLRTVSEKSDNTQTVRDTLGRYSHGPEPVGKTMALLDEANKSDNTKDTNKFQMTLPVVRFPFNNKKSKGKNDAFGPTYESYDAVLEYLKRQSAEPISLRNPYISPEGENGRNVATMSPVAINFKSDGRTINGKEVVPIMGNTGLRSKNQFDSFL